MKIGGTARRRTSHKKGRQQNNRGSRGASRHCVAKRRACARRTKSFRDEKRNSEITREAFEELMLLSPLALVCNK